MSYLSPLAGNASPPHSTLIVMRCLLLPSYPVVDEDGSAPRPVISQTVTELPPDWKEFLDDGKSCN